MKYKNYIAPLLLLSSFANTTQAAEMAESEPNDTLSTAQQVAVPADSAIINAVLGKLTGSAVSDLDFFSFTGQEGDVVTLDIDGGMGGDRSVDTIIAVFDSNGNILRINDDAYPRDPGSISSYDSRIDNLLLPATGEYVVGVSNYPRYFRNDGTVVNAAYVKNGNYAMVISGVTPVIQQINIDIKPGNDDIAPLNRKSRGKIPVALLSSSTFNALNTKTQSLTFGATGKEVSLSRCGTKGEDVNNDGLPDLVCHFENQKAGFVKGSLEATLRGKLKDGTRFEGRAYLKVVGEKGNGL